MIERLQNFILKFGNTIRARWYLCVLCYALITASIFAVWLLLDGDSVAFVYSEF